VVEVEVGRKEGRAKECDGRVGDDIFFGNEDSKAQAIPT